MDFFLDIVSDIISTALISGSGLLYVLLKKTIFNLDI